MEVKEAVKKALEYAAEAFSEGRLSNLGLEEVVYDDARACWKVTVGFSRPWDYPRGVMEAVVGLPAMGRPANRTYKVVEIRDSDGVATAIRMREMGGDE